MYTIIKTDRMDGKTTNHEYATDDELMVELNRIASRINNTVTGDDVRRDLTNGLPVTTMGYIYRLVEDNPK
jgi:hypothetical protein